MKKLKKLFAMLLAAALLLSTAACTSGQPESKAPSSSSKASSSSGESSSQEDTAEPGNTGSGAKLQLILPSNSTPFPDGMSENDNFLVDYWR